MVETATRPKTICDLEDIIESLPESERDIVNSLFLVSSGNAIQNCSALGSPELSSQEIVKVMNRWTYAYTKYNHTRSLRPMAPPNLVSLKERIENERGKDPFCKVEEKTPVDDRFGRIKGETCVTAANLYPYGVNHCVIIFNNHDPLVFPTEGEFKDRLSVNDRWMKAVHSHDPHAVYPSYIYNSLPIGGASLIHAHGHGQLEQGFHEAGMCQLADVSNFYGNTRQRNYIGDLCRAHQALGLGFEVGGVTIQVPLAAAKERHVDVMTYSFDENARSILYRLVDHMVNDEGVLAYNLTIAYPRLNDEGEHINGPIPFWISMIDRGNGKADSSTADFGGSESSFNINSRIVATDPFKVAAGIKKSFS